MGLLRAAAALIALAWLAAATSASAPSEYQLKAVFLFNFAQFVEWPSQSFGAPDAPFVIGVVGEDPFGGELDAVVRGETVLGHPLVVKRYRTLSEVKPCQILFISESELSRLDNILSSLDRRAVLTVSDIYRAAERGTVIQFTNERNRLRLRINVAAAKAAGLTISSKLLRPAEIVDKREG
jgi:YfiR/HmsC-like